MAQLVHSNSILEGCLLDADAVTTVHDMDDNELNALGAGGLPQLAKNLAIVQNLLVKNHASVLRILSKTTEGTAQLEAENVTMREKLMAAGLNIGFGGFSDTGGSGELGMQKPPPATSAQRQASSVKSPRTESAKVKYGWEPLPSSLLGQVSAPNTVKTAKPSAPVACAPVATAWADRDTKTGISHCTSAPSVFSVPEASNPLGVAPGLEVPGAVPDSEVIICRNKQQTKQSKQNHTRVGLIETDLTDDSQVSNVPASTTIETTIHEMASESFLNSEGKSSSNYISVVPATPGGGDTLGQSDTMERVRDKEKARQASHVHNQIVKHKVEETRAEWGGGKTGRSHDAENMDGKSAPKTVFADAAAMKDKLRAAIGKPEYDVRNFYWKKGIWQAIARHHIFEHITLSVIGVNALWIAVDTDYNTADFILKSHIVFQLAENAFCFYFSFEWLVRYLAFEVKANCLKDAWFVFDSTLVAIMVAETWILPASVIVSGGGSGGGLGNAGVLKLLRLMRLSRMARMARLFKAFPELMIMIKGMAVAMRSVFFTLCLLFIIVYVFAIAFVQLMGPKGALQPLSDKFNPELFKSVPVAINNLLLGGTLPDQADLINQVGEEHFVLRLVIMCFILLAALTVMNMLVGVLCEVVSVVSAVEKEALLVNFVKTQLQDMLERSGLDTNNDQKISRSEFESLLEKPEAARALNEVGVDVVGLVDFTDFIFTDDTELTFSDFMDVILQLRGSNTATVKDIVDLRKLVMAQFDAIVEKGVSSHHSLRGVKEF